MKKRGRKGQTGNPGRKRPRGPAPEDRPGGLAGWLSREHAAFFNLSFRMREVVVFLALLVVGAVVWVWRSVTG